MWCCWTFPDPNRCLLRKRDLGLVQQIEYLSDEQRRRSAFFSWKTS